MGKYYYYEVDYFSFLNDRWVMWESSLDTREEARKSKKDCKQERGGGLVRIIKVSIEEHREEVR